MRRHPEVISGRVDGTEKAVIEAAAKITGEPVGAFIRRLVVPEAFRIVHATTDRPSSSEARR